MSRIFVWFLFVFFNVMKVIKDYVFFYNCSMASLLCSYNVTSNCLISFFIYLFQWQTNQTKYLFFKVLLFNIACCVVWLYKWKIRTKTGLWFIPQTPQKFISFYTYWLNWYKELTLLIFVHVNFFFTMQISHLKNSL